MEKQEIKRRNSNKYFIINNKIFTKHLQMTPFIIIEWGY